MLKRSWVEINLDTLENNFNIYKSHLAEGQEIMAVVKADAYGHGDQQVAKRLDQMGVRNFAVSNINEAVTLRMAGAKGQIIVLGYTPVEAIPQLLSYDVTQTLLSEEFAEYFAGAFKSVEKSKKLKVQFAVDTGMNRIGLDGDDVSLCEKAIRKYYEVFDMTGLFSHLCVADTPAEKEFTDGQIAKFKAVCESVADLNLKYIHCMNTAGGFYCEPFGNMVRLGITMYGLKPDYDNVLPEGIKPALTWKSVIAQIKTVKKGESVGYGRTFIADRDMTVATIPTGYADGYSRLLSNKGVVIVGGKKAPVIGRVCMDQLMVDVTGLDAKFEDEVILMGEDYTADDLANSIGTVGYEIICAISKRVPREYV